MESGGVALRVTLRKSSRRGRPIAVLIQVPADAYPDNFREVVDATAD